MRMEKHSTSKPNRAAGVQVNTSPRSPRAVNLSRLSQQIDVDLLAAALLMRETILRSFIQGREPVRNEYAQQIGIHLAEAGFPAHWLDKDNAPVTKANIEALREMAALSVEKSPVRRDNLRELAKAFQGSLQLLADALEITEDSLSNIVEGTVKFDEQRMGHVNPRLMAAGFPNSWLELPNAKVEPEWVEALKTMATDAYETAFELEQEKERAAEKARAAEEAARIAALAVPPAPAQPIETPKEKPIVATVKTTAAKAGKQPVPVPAAKAAAPVAPRLPAGIPRGALGAGRPAGAMTPPKPAAATTRARPVAAEGTPKAQSLLRAAALEKLLDMARRGSKACLWRDLLGKSLPYWGNVRNGAIMLRDDLADEITAALGLPKGWLDNPVFPPPTVAAWVMDHTVPLPAGKEAVAAPAPAVAAPSPAPAKTATKLPVKPAAPKPAVAKAPPAVAPPAPPMPMSAVKARAVAGLGRAIAGKAAVPASRAETPSPAPKPEAAAAPPPPAAPTVTSAPVAPAVVPVAAAPTPAEAGFAWKAPANPEPQAAPGHLVQALVGQINKMAEAGTFTEQDALRLLYYMMIPH